LYIGTDDSAYVSFNRGESWERFSANLPNVAVHDIRIQAEAKDLVLGTHGRSIYKTNIGMLQEMTPQKLKEALVIFEMEKVRHSSRWGTSWSKWRVPSEPEISVGFYTSKPGAATLSIKSNKGIVLFTKKQDVEKGFNSFTYDLSLSESGKTALIKEDKTVVIEKKKNTKYYLPKGNYTVEVSINGNTEKKEIALE